MGQPQRRILGDIGDIGPPALAAADSLFDLFGRVPDHDADIDDAGIANRLDHAEQDRLVCHRDQLLGAGERQRVESSSLASSQYQTFHAFSFGAMSCESSKLYKGGDESQASIGKAVVGGQNSVGLSEIETGFVPKKTPHLSRKEDSQVV